MIVAACCRQAAGYDDVNNGNRNGRHFHHPTEYHDHNYGHIQHGSVVESSRVRHRTLVKDVINATMSMSSSGRCATIDPSTEKMTESSRIVRKWTTNPKSRQATTIDVNAYFHIVMADFNVFTGENETVGIVTDADVTNQLQVLNDSFRPYGFTFTLKGTTRNNNTDWYYFNEYEMKSALRVGDASTLNVYFKDARGRAGYAAFPWEYEQSPKNDGVVVYSLVIPGGPYLDRNEGKTLVHEVGHWLGLLHTFQFKRTIPVNANSENTNSILYTLRHCLLNDDLIKDTPRQKSPTDGCPTSRNSCIFYRGSDPIHNYMDYSDDRCVNEFTSGQVDRMKAMWNEYRAAG
jgi:Pregnancy-associated plasma protein-A